MTPLSPLNAALAASSSIGTVRIVVPSLDGIDGAGRQPRLAEALEERRAILDQERESTRIV